MEFVKLVNAGAVTRIIMNRPQLHNAFNAQMIAELTQAFQQAATDDYCRVVILQSEGSNFSAGADLNWMQSMAELDYQDNLADARQLAELMHQVYCLPKMVIARVQGAAYGGALGLICACDVAIAEQSASFCLSEVKIGLAPAVISPYVIAAMGERNARRYMLTAEVIDAVKAHALGLIHEYCATAELDQRVTQLAQTAAANGPNAVATCKQLIQSIANWPEGSEGSGVSAEIRELTATVIARLRVTDEGQEGLTAFLQKRVPAWRDPASEDKPAKGNAE